MTHRILVVDDHEVVRLGLRTLLSNQPDFVVVDEAGSAEEALVKALAHRPNVVVMDIRMPGKSGIEACREIKSQLPDVAIIMNEPSLVKFQPGIAQGGVIIANSTLIEQSVYERGDDVRIFWVPATQTARDVAGTDRSANMVALGAFLAVEPIVEVATVEAILRELSDERKRALIEKNIAALEAGRDLVAAQVA